MSRSDASPDMDTPVCDLKPTSARTLQSPHLKGIKTTHGRSTFRFFRRRISTETTGAFLTARIRRLHARRLDRHAAFSSDTTSETGRDLFAVGSAAQTSPHTFAGPPRRGHHLRFAPIVPFTSRIVTSLHDGRMTPYFNYALERSVGGASRLHATETRPRVCEPNGKAQLT